MIDLFRPPWLSIRIASCPRRSPQRVLRRTVLSQLAKLVTSPQRRQRQYVCGVEAEDPHAYLRGVYFPVELRNVFKNGRYVVLHKLGWGGYATVWLARDTLCVYCDPMAYAY